MNRRRKVALAAPFTHVGELSKEAATEATMGEFIRVSSSAAVVAIGNCE